MPTYDFWRKKSVTSLGQGWMQQAALFTLTRLQEHAPLARDIVEIGPGRGVFMQACLAKGLRYTAVDINPGLLQALHGQPAVCADAPRLALADGVCDAVVASHVFEHMRDIDQARAFLNELIRIVRPGGLIVLTTPDVLWYGSYFWDCDYTHNFPTSARRLQQMFLDHHLDISDISYVHNHVTGFAGVCLGYAARLVPYRLPGRMPGQLGYSDHIYKARLTFARCVCIVGRVGQRIS